MARTTYSVNTDGWELDGAGAVDLTSATNAVGDISGSYVQGAYRFTSVAIPQATTIRSAVFKVYLGTITTSTMSAFTACENVDNSAALTTTAGSISSRAKTTAQQTHFLHDLSDGYVYLDVTASVQEVINRGGWASGNALTVIFYGTDSSLISSSFTVSNSESANDPELYIDYGDSATSALYPTVSGTGTWVNPNNAFSDNGVNATIENSLNGSQIWESFGITGVSGTVDGILIEVEGFVSSTSSRSQFSVELSWDGGTSWTTAKKTIQVQVTPEIHKFGGADPWSHTFTVSELSNANFKVRVSCDFASSSNDGRIDFVRATVFYTPSGGNVTTTKTQTGVSRIQKTVTQTQTGKARLQKTITQTQTGISRLAITTQRTQTGLSRIQKVVTQTITGKSAVQNTTARTTTGQTRIQKSATQTQTGVSRIAITTTRNQTGIARITAITQKTQSGVGNIRNTTLRIQNGLARVTATATKTQTGVSRVQKTATQTQQGTSRITAIVQKTQTGKGNIRATTQQTQTGKARITATTQRTQSGVANIVVPTPPADPTNTFAYGSFGYGQVAFGGAVADTSIVSTQTQTGLARIQKTVTQTQTGKANIAIRATQTITGVSRITAVTTQTQTGRARILVTTTRTITGIAKISAKANQTITGKARITPHLNYSNKYNTQNSSYDDKYTTRNSSYSDKYSSQGSNYSDKYTNRGSSYSDKLTPRNTPYEDKY